MIFRWFMRGITFAALYLGLFILTLACLTALRGYNDAVLAGVALMVSAAILCVIVAQEVN